MNRFVYILTDCNRKCLHVGMTDDLLKTVTFYKEHKQLFFDVDAQICRLVYFEELRSEEASLSRFNLLKVFTRSQKERLIRAVNKDWIDLSLGLDVERALLGTAKPFKSARSLYLS